MNKDKYINLLREIVSAQTKERDQNTVLGAVWSVLHPLALLGVLVVFFQLRFSARIEHYALYLLVGIIQYTHFANATWIAMHMLQGKRDLTCNAIFPKEILILGSVLSKTLDFAISLMICLGLAVIAGVPISWSVLLLPLVAFVQIILVLWVSLVLSCTYTFIRDLDHIYQVFLRILLFITPIFYDLSYLGEGLAKTIAELNPLAQLISFSRLIIIKADAIPVGSFLVMFVLNLLFLYGAFKTFKHFEPMFAERL